MALNNVGLNRRIKIIPFVKEEEEEEEARPESEESDVISKGDFRNLEDYDSGDCGDSEECGGDSENQDQDQEDDNDNEDDPYFEEYNAAHLQTPVTPLPPLPPVTPVTSWVRFKDACEKVYLMWHYQLAAYIVQNTYMPCPVENPVLISYIVSETMYGPLIPRPPNAVMLACKMHDDEYFLRHNIENPFDKIKREAAAFKVKVLVVGDAQIEYQLL